MSTTIDNRVVEMRFDNAQFEKNVSTTMSTLEKLKQKLKLTGASKGIDEVNSAAKRVDLSGVGKGVEAVSKKFSALEIMGTTALVNITNQAVNAGKRMISALTIDPIKTGFQEYETQINAVQTILANTSSKGTTIDDVNAALEELNKYADMTIYNFTEMTRNIGTFTAAGIDLETSTNAIQGIANLAAVSGSTSQQASTAMYQLSQALAAGTVKLMDWNSVVNAGMGGQVFQDALKETSELLGTGAEAAIKTSGSFRESLQAGWLTSEVLTETLKKFTSSGANEAVAKYTGLTTEAVESALESAEAQYGEAEAIEYASKALAEKSGKSADEIKQTLMFAKTATDAATKVKTFTQLWDVMKESAQSGWSQTWKLLVGDFEQAKNLLTPLADFFTNAIGKMSDARNTLLEGALGQSFKGLVEKVQKIVDPIKNTADSIKEVTDSVLDYATVVDEIIGGKWGNGQERWNKLAESGYDWAHAQNLVNEKLGDATRHATNYQEAQNGVSEAQKESAEAQGAMSDATIDLIADLASLSDAQLKEKGYSEEQIKAFRDLADAADKTGIPIKDFLKNIDQIDGRFLLINSFKNVGQGLVAIFKAIGEAWRDAFPPMQSDQLFNIIAGIHKFTTYLKVDSETADNLTRTFKGLFAILDIGANIIGGGVKFAFKLLTEILGYFNMDILDVTAGVGDAIVKFRDWFESVTDVSQVLDVVVPLLKDGIAAIKEWLKSFKEIPGVEKFLDSVRSIFELIGNKNFEFGGDGFTKIFDAVRTAFGKLRQINLRDVGTYIFEGLVLGLGEGAKSVIQKVLEVGKSLIEKFCSLLGINSPSTVFIALGGFIISGLILGIKEGLLTVPDAVKELVEKTVGVLQNIDWGTIFAIGVSLVAANFIRKLGNALESIASPFEGLGEIFESVSEVVQSFDKVMKAVAFNIKMKALKQLALAILILAGAVVALSFIDPLKAWNAVGIVVVLAGVMGGLAWAISKLSDASLDIDMKSGKLNMSGLRQSLITIGAAILLLGVTVKLVGSMDPWDAVQGVLGLVAVMGAMIGFIYLAQKLTRNGVAEDIGKIGGLMITLSLAMALMIGVIKLASKLSSDELTRGGAFAAGFVGFVAAICTISKKDNKKIEKLGRTMIALTVSMGLMIGVVKLVNRLDAGEMIKGALFATAFVLFVKGLVKAATVGKDNSIAKLGGMLLSISISMALMVGICKIIDTLSVGEMLKGALFAAAFVLFVKGLVTVLSVGSDVKMAKVAGTIIGLSFAIGILAAVCVMLSLVKWEGLTKGLIGVGLLSSFVALMIYSTKDMPEGIFKNITALAIAVAVLAAAMAVLSFIPIDKLAVGVSAMAILIGSFSLLLYSSKNIGKGMGTLIMLTIMIAEVAGIVWLLDKLDVQNALINAAALSVLLISVSASMLILSKISTGIGKALLGALALTAMAVPMLAFVGVLYLMDKVQNAISNAEAITKLMVTMTGCLAALTIIGFAWPAAAAGIIALTAMAIPMLAFVGVLALMNKVENAAVNALLLTDLMTVMTDLLVKVSLVGPLAIIGVASMTGLTLLMGAIGIMAVAIGALMEKFPSIQKFLDTGLPVLEQLAGSIGKMIGKFVGGIGEGLGDSLVKLGEDIAAFMEQMEKASVSASGIKADSFEGFRDLIDALAEVGSTTVGLTFADMFTVGGTSMEKFEADGKAFFKALKGISTEMVGFAMPDTFSPDALKTLVEAIKTVGKTTIGLSIADMFAAGDQTAMEKFESDGKAFFKAIKGISEEMTGFSLPDDFSSEALVELIDALKTVGKTSIGLSIADWFATGDQTAMGKFESDGKAFFKAIKGISTEMVGIELPKDFSSDTLVTLLDALKSVGGAMVGTTLADIFSFGESAIEKFKTDGVGFFSAIKAISDKSANINMESFSIAGTAIDRIRLLIDKTKNIDYSGVETFTGIGTGGFGADGPLHDIGVAIQDFSNQVALINIAAIETSVVAAGKIKSLISGLVGLDISGVEKFTGVGTGGFGADGPLRDIGAAIKAYNTQVAGIDAGVVSSSVSTAIKLKNLINGLAGLDTGGVGPFANAIESLGKIQVGNIEKAFSGAVPNLTIVGGKLIDAIITGMRSRQALLINTSNIIIQSTYQTALSTVAVFTMVGSTLINHFANGMRINALLIPMAMTSSLSSAVSNACAYYGSFYSAGSYLVDGFAAGITDNAWKAAARAAAMADAAKRAAENALGIKSPSRVFYKIGEYTGEGFINALKDYATQVYNAGADMGSSAKDGMNDAIRKIADVASGDIDLQPTIRPVLDLSNIKSGAGAIGGLLGAGSSVDVLARVGAINNSMNRNIQNGGNTDVISAIDKLRGAIGNMSNTTYQVNGITYDDGSNITDAVSQLVRAAKIGRRV